MKVIIIGAASHGKGAIKRLLEGLDNLDYPLKTEVENLSYAHLSLPEAGFTLKPGSTCPVEFKSFAVLSRSLSSLSAIAYMNRNDGLAKVHIEAAESDEEAAEKAAEEALATQQALADEEARKEEQAKADKAAEETRAATEKAAADKAEKEKAEKAKADKAKADADAKAAAKAKAAEEAAAAKAATETGDNKAEGSEPAAKAVE